MADILLELLGCILEPLLDALFQYVLAALVDVLFRSLGEAFKGAEIQDPALASAGFAFSGLILGGIMPFALSPSSGTPVKVSWNQPAREPRDYRSDDVGHRSRPSPAGQEGNAA